MGGSTAETVSAEVAAETALTFEGRLAQKGILGMTEHGAEQMISRGFTEESVLEIIKGGVVKEVVYKGQPQIHYVLGQYRIATAVLGKNAGKIISIMGNYNTIGNGGMRGIFVGF